MIIRFFGGIRQQLGMDVLELKLEQELELNQLLEMVARELGPSSTLIFRSGKLRPELKLMLNGEYIESPNQVIRDEDELAILPPVSGG